MELIIAVQGPESDQDDESELSVAELKVQRERQKKEVEVLHQLEAKEMEEFVERKMKADHDVGCTWGFGTYWQFFLLLFQFCGLFWDFRFLSSQAWDDALIELQFCLKEQIDIYSSTTHLTSIGARV